MVESASFGNDRSLASSVSETIEVLAGPPPVEQEAGIRVPGINVSMLVAILGAVWWTDLTVMVLLMRVARRGSPAAPGTGEWRG